MRRREEQSAHMSCGNISRRRGYGRSARPQGRHNWKDRRISRVHVPLAKRCPRLVAQAAAGPQAVLVPVQHVMADDGLWQILKVIGVVVGP